MTVREFVFDLKDGRKALARSPRDEDIPATLDYLYQTACETDYLLRCPEECGKYTPEGEKAFFDRINSSDNGAMIMCFVDGKLAGNCEITWSKGLKTRHRASVAIALRKDFWGLGIGTRLLAELEKIAREQEEILQLELDFIEGNARARALYEKTGFRITGVKPDAIRLKDGTMRNEYSMVKVLKR